MTHKPAGTISKMITVAQRLMNLWKRKPFRIGVGIGISLFFLWMVFKDIEFQEIIQDIKEIQALWLIPAIICYFAGVWVRTARWRILLRPIKRCTTAKLF